MKSCVFCGGEPTNKEHVLPEWMARTLGVTRLSVTTTSDLVSTRSSWETANSFGLTVGATCCPCNNGWMSALEVAAQGYLTPLILGRPVDLEPRDQLTFAEWLWKTCLISDLTVPGPHRAFAAKDYQAFKADKRIPDSTVMWFGGFGPGSAARFTTGSHVVVSDGIGLGHIWLFTWVFGCLTAQVMYATAGRSMAIDLNARSGKPVDDAMARFWPPETSSIRRPAVYLTAESYALLSDRWNEVKDILKWR